MTLDQKGCDYTPHMVAMVAGQGLKIRNSDDTLHNIHPRPTANEEFNFGQAKQGMEKTKVFDKAEVMIPVGCDVHPWMRAYISVLSQPVLRGQQGRRDASRSRGFPRASTRSKPSTASSRARPRRSR